MLSVPTGEIGELQVRGCSVFSGYVGNAAANSENFTADGWFRTGDLADMDGEGNVRLRGRIKDIINRGGVKFNPAKVESIIASHPAVAQVAVAPVPDAVLSERAACFVVLHERARLGIKELTRFLAERKVAKFMWPEQLEIVADMPMTPTRKVIKPNWCGGCSRNRRCKAVRRHNRRAADLALAVYASPVASNAAVSRRPPLPPPFAPAPALIWNWAAACRREAGAKRRRNQPIRKGFGGIAMWPARPRTGPRWTL